ncbi:hypothetical protein KZI27_03910 [Curtobacterium sp. TC1]|uniref:hypothetical protein n=1 Tax=Curtobacterium sp. TC1 TaxID=2862880 RepID=UPI001C9B96FB|nr:hypothetical protein [Curtobacterium sp. TC1]QZQ56006.1 hypothetical protein KZI27_03910 [Curtobacterium sp. TC1]
MNATTTRRTRSLLALAAAAFLLPSLLAACTAGPDDEADTAPGSAVKGSSLAECMRGKGYDMPDPSGGGSTMRLSVPDGADPEQYQSDLAECLGDDEGAGDVKAAKPMPGSEETLREVAECIRDGGFSDYPDDEGGQRAYRADDSAAFDEVARACTDEAFGTAGTAVDQ